MAKISVSDLTFCYEGSFDNIFEQVSFSVDTDWKLGFIGRNGKGKTTFLNLLMGKYEYQGSIQTQTAFDYFPYQISESQMKRCMADFMEEIAGDAESWRVIMEMEKLHMEAELLYRPFETLSHGERTRVMLAILFSRDNYFLLIDEPTNHLDLESRACVKEYLNRKKGFLLVSHDRDLLDACVDHILVLNRVTIEVQKGNFSSWWENKQRMDAFHEAENEKHRKEITKLKEAADRVERWAEKSENGKIGYDPVKEHDRSKNTRAYIGAKTKAMQKRVKQMGVRIEREIEEKEGLLQDIEKPVDLKVMPIKHHKEVLIRTDKYGLSYGAHQVLHDFDFELRQGERVLLRGANGSGKSSFIKAILRQLDLERVQFAKRMEEYSEGQKKKVLIAASLLKQAHLYIWDEPLNYIDVFSRVQIEELLLCFRPTMLLVEHDICFQEKIATRVVDF